MNFTCPTNVLFECSRCGLCCGDTPHKKRHILLLESETNAISAETRLSKQEFAKPVTDRNPYYYEMKKSREGKEWKNKMMKPKLKMKELETRKPLKKGGML